MKLELLTLFFNQKHLNWCINDSITVGQFLKTKYVLQIQCLHQV